MQWHKLSSKKSSNIGQSDRGVNAMRLTVPSDKIDGVHDRRNKYLGGMHHTSFETPDITADRQKNYVKHLAPLSPNGSTGRQQVQS